jgi:hypothetical protein
MEMYLTLGYVSFFTIHSRYIQDTLRIQCILTLRYMTHKIHTRYTHDTCRIHRDTFEDTYLEPYLPRPRLDERLGMYPACLLHIRYISVWMILRYMYLIMYLGCIPHVS